MCGSWRSLVPNQRFMVVHLSYHLVYLQLQCETKIIQKISDKYVIKIRCLVTPLSHFAHTGHSAHRKISDEYVIKTLIEGSA